MKRIFMVAAGIFIGSHLSAQQQDSATKQLDEVIVTANRLQQKQSQTGKVITVIGKDILEKNQGRSITQVLNEQAGITVNGALNNSGTVQTTYMRGAGSGRTLILLDGIPVSDPSQINNEFDLNLLFISDIERIEIARGAQSTLYGSDAVAGVINIITQKQNTRKPIHIKSTLTAGNQGTFRNNIQLYGKVDNLSYNVRFSGMNSKGFSAAQDTFANKNFDRDGFRGTSSAASVQYQVSNYVVLKSFIQHNRYRTSIDERIFTDDKDFVQRSSNLNTGAGFVYKNKGVTVTGNYMYSENRRNFLNDSSDVGGFAKYAKDDYSGKNQFAELFATVQLSKQFTLLQGADYRFNSFNNQYFSVSSFGPFNSRFPDTSISQQSMYASLLFNGLEEKLNIELGGRLNVHSRFGSNHTFTFNPSYSLNQNIRLFGSIATGFKAPSLYQLYSFAGNKELKPEQSINYEIGIQHSSRNIRQQAVFFYRELETGLDFDNINFTYYNIPNQVVRGLEYEAIANPVKKLTVAANYTLLAGNEFVQSRITTNDTAYTYLLRRPKHNFNLNMSYAVTKRFSVSLTSKYVSKRFDAGGFMAKDELLKSYFILGAYAEYKWSSLLRVFADAQNITNRKFFDIRGFNSIPFLVHAGITIGL
jgi:vitamin B12 transporter